MVLRSTPVERPIAKTFTARGSPWAVFFWQFHPSV